MFAHLVSAVLEQEEKDVLVDTTWVLRTGNQQFVIVVPSLDCL